MYLCKTPVYGSTNSSKKQKLGHNTRTKKGFLSFQIYHRQRHLLQLHSAEAYDHIESVSRMQKPINRDIHHQNGTLTLIR